MKHMSCCSSLVLLLFVSVGCTPNRAVLTATDSDSLQQAYAAALKDAQRPTVAEIDQNLIALIPATDKLVRLQALI